MRLNATCKPLAFAGALALSVLVAGPVIAQEAEIGPNDVVARVNGDDITRADLDDFGRELGGQLARLPPDQQFSVILNILVDVRLMARAAEAEGLPEDEEVARRLRNARDSMLREEYLRLKAFEPITDAALMARYEEEIANFEPEDEIRARHILVADEAEARTIIEELDGGADFAELASAKSIDPGSGRNGGDLGFFTRGDMVKPFADAAFSLEPGSYTAEPVQSQFGFHIILVEEAREQPVPSFASRQEELRQEMLSDALVEVSQGLREGAEIEVMGADGELVPMDDVN